MTSQTVSESRTNSESWTRFLGPLFVLAMLFALFFGFAAHAQVTSTLDVVTTAPAQSAFVSALLTLLPHLVEIVAGLLLTFCFPAIVKWIAAKKTEAVAAGKNTTLLSVSEKVEHLAELVVANVDAKAKQAIDGKMTPAQMRELALADLKSLLTPDGLVAVAEALGSKATPAPVAAVDTFLAAHNEAAVDVKNARPTQPPATA